MQAAVQIQSYNSLSELLAVYLSLIKKHWHKLSREHQSLFDLVRHSPATKYTLSKQRNGAYYFTHACLIYTGIKFAEFKQSHSP